jgi:LEA14-like dessication related protein
VEGALPLRRAGGARRSAALKTALLCALLATASACEHLREAIGLGPRRPKVQLVDLQVARASKQALDLAVSLRVTNPNDFALRLDKLRYTAQAAGLKVAAGEAGERVEVPAAGEAVVKLPLAVDPNAALSLLHQLLTRPDEIYLELEATADFLTPVGAMEVGFTDKRPLRKLAGF